jgi:tetratricopeptide (TPR) repeat protein
MSANAAELAVVRRPRPASRLSAAFAVGVACLLAPLTTGAPAAASVAGGLELSRPVEASLTRLQEQWLRWLTSFYQSDADQARAALDDLLATANQLGMDRLPDLALGAAARAVQSQRENNPTRADWALEAAERLDPGRPETAFAEASVRWQQGAYHRALGRQLAGYGRLLRLPPWGEVWARSLALWLLAALLLASGLFVAMAMAVRGSVLLVEARRLLRALPWPVGMAVALVLLAWPLALPSGLLWLLLYWSVLLWSHGGFGERVVYGLGWLLLASAPFASEAISRPVQVELSPAMRAARSLAAGRLYGALFTDLGVLRAQLPDSPAVTQLMADLYRHLGQWEQARPLYMDLLRNEPQNVPALLAVGAYHFRKSDFGNAVQYFQRAATAAPQSAAAFYDLSIAYSEAYQFDESHRALRQAQTLDTLQVSSWIQQSGDERVVTADGGTPRTEEIATELRRGRGEASAAAAMGTRRRVLAPLAAVVAALLAAALGVTRRQLASREGATPPASVETGSRPTGFGLPQALRAFLPGYSALATGSGLVAFAALIAVSILLTLPFTASLGFRIPLGFDPGPALAWTVSVVGLLTILAWRLRGARRNEL